MPEYQVRAKNLKGEDYRTEIEARNLEELKSIIERKGYFILSYTRKKKEVELPFLSKSIKSKDLASFSRQFSVILQSGITILGALDILKDQTESKKLKAILIEIYNEFQKGKMLSELIDEYEKAFPEFFRSMIKIGEKSGELEKILSTIADYYEKDAKTRSKIKSAMIYPMILAVLTVALIVLMMLFIVPMFTGMFTTLGSDLPTITKIVFSSSNFIKDNIIVIAIVMAILIGIIPYYKGTYNGQKFFDKLKLNLPIIKKPTMKIISARFARSLGILLASGVSMVDSLDVVKNVLGNKVVEERIDAYSFQIREGKGLSGPIQKIEYFPPMIKHMVFVGEQTGELDAMLTKTADFFDREVEDATAKLTALIEPIMIVIMAIIVGFIVVSIFLPMLSIMNTV